MKKQDSNMMPNPRNTSRAGAESRDDERARLQYDAVNWRLFSAVLGIGFVAGVVFAVLLLIFGVIPSEINIGPIKFKIPVATQESEQNLAEFATPIVSLPPNTPYAPNPTFSPYSTYTPYPTYTLYPTFTPYPTYTPYPTFTPDLSQLRVVTVVNHANEELKLALTDIPRNWAKLQRYWCGEQAWNELTNFKERIVTDFGIQVTAWYTVTVSAPPYLGSDGRYSFYQTETWTLSSAKAKSRTETRDYIYVMRETQDKEIPYCIDEYLYSNRK
jgi:tetrahydromethanopterin S-methyltransferase subunit F